MGDVALRVEGLGKQYRLGRSQERYSTIRDQIGKWASAPLRALRRGGRAEPQPEFWALKDVSFEVKPGEVVGIIGRNGAGKSTLLKILSRVTEPTEGGADLYGRVGSLLEVGTGFHPELTGRENIFLNGAILGMRRREIARKFDDIVAFAEIEKFIDTPVKRYSSGMYTRLAFAVAAHMDTEILIVDEVLAVGDAEFQKKCLGKMGEVAKEGRTVLFVSHNMSAMQVLCTRIILLSKGKLEGDGRSADIIPLYLEGSSRHIEPGEVDRFRIHGDRKEVYLTKVELLSGRAGRHELDEELSVRLTIQADTEVSDLNAAVAIFTRTGAIVGTLIPDQTFATRSGERRVISITIGGLRLAPGSYHMSVSLGKGGLTFPRSDYDVVLGTPSFDVLPYNTKADIALPGWHAGWGAVVITNYEYAIE